MVQAGCWQVERKSEAPPAKVLGRFSAEQGPANQTRPEEADFAAKEIWKARTQALLHREISFIPNRVFSEPDACKLTTTELPMAEQQSESALRKMPAHLLRMCETPLLTATEERELFRRMNYLKFRVHQIRTELNPRRPNRRKVEQADQMLAEADQIMQRLVSANIRLVISIIRKLQDGGQDFDELLSDGITSLMNAVEKFDFDRGFRFSTYATMVMKRHLFRCIKRAHRDRSRYPNGDPALLLECPQRDGGQRLTESQWSDLTSTLDAMLFRLDEREQRIIRERFGFDSQGKKRSLQSIAVEFGVCKERVRQLEKRAMAKLRDWADVDRLDELLDAD